MPTGFLGDKTHLVSLLADFSLFSELCITLNTQHRIEHWIQSYKRTWLHVELSNNYSLNKRKWSLLKCKPYVNFPHTRTYEKEHIYILHLIFFVVFLGKQNILLIVRNFSFLLSCLKKLHYIHYLTSYNTCNRSNYCILCQIFTNDKNLACHQNSNAYNVVTFFFLACSYLSDHDNGEAILKYTLSEFQA